MNLEAVPSWRSQDMIATPKTHLDLDTYIEVVQQAKESLELLALLEEVKSDTEKCPPVSSLIASYLITDLYSEQSSNEANINRITTNLEAAADDLVMISKLIRSLAQH
jgi:hypothetical protein